MIKSMLHAYLPGNYKRGTNSIYILAFFNTNYAARKSYKIILMMKEIKHVKSEIK